MSAIREHNCLKHRERFLGADISISKITSRQILAYRGGLLERGLSATTANHHVKALRSVLRLAKTEKYISKLPMDGIPDVPKGRGRSIRSSRSSSVALSVARMPLKTSPAQR
jgi:site-specific recombinase XerD